MKIQEIKESKVTEAMKRPQLSIPPTQQELEQAFQQLSSMCDAYETTIEMQKEEAEKAFRAGWWAGAVAFRGHKGDVRDKDYAAYRDTK